MTDGWLYKTLSLPSQPAAMLFSGYETMESKGKGTGVLTPARQGMVKKLGELGLPVYGLQVAAGSEGAREPTAECQWLPPVRVPES